MGARATVLGWRGRRFIGAKGLRQTLRCRSYSRVSTEAEISTPAPGPDGKQHSLPAQSAKWQQISPQGYPCADEYRCPWYKKYQLELAGL